VVAPEYRGVYKWTVVGVVAWLLLVNLACEAIKWNIRNAVPIEIGTPEYVEIYGHKPNRVVEYVRSVWR
jgi:hypothetical protein